MSQVLNQQERNRLAEEGAGRADVELNRVYKRLVTSLERKPGALTALKTAQNAWIAFRDAELAVAVATFGEGSGQRAVVGGVNGRITSQRVTGLLLALTGPSVLGDGKDDPAADALLNRIWRSVSSDEHAATERVKAQRAWLKYRDAEGALWSALGGSSNAIRVRLTWERCWHFDA